jgi:hypothetical protein
VEVRVRLFGEARRAKRALGIATGWLRTRMASMAVLVGGSVAEKEL